MDKKKKKDHNKNQISHDRKKEIKITEQESHKEPISISELKQNYDVKRKNPLLIIIIFLIAICAIGYFGHNYILDFFETNEETGPVEITKEPQNQIVEQKELTCEEAFLELLPDKIILIRQVGSEGDWIFNPLDNKFNNYTNGMPLIPQRNLFYTKMRTNEYIAREGMSSTNYFKYLSANLVAEYNIILSESGLPEEVIDIKGIPMTKRTFSVKEAQITRCTKI